MLTFIPIGFVKKLLESSIFGRKDAAKFFYQVSRSDGLHDNTLHIEIKVYSMLSKRREISNKISRKPLTYGADGNEHILIFSPEIQPAIRPLFGLLDTNVLS